MHPTSPQRDDFGDPNGLIRLPSSGGLSKGWQRLLLAIFLCVTALAAVVDLLLPIDLPPLVGQEKAARQARWQAVTWHDGSLARWVEEDRHLRSRIRHHLLPPYALLLYQTLGEVRGELLHGRGGWLFLRDRVLPRPEADDLILQRAAQSLARLQDELAEDGHRLLIVPLPRKAALMPEKLPKGTAARPQLDRRLPQVLTAEGVDFVDLFPVLDGFQDTSGESPYFRGDSHLTPQAMVTSSEAIARHLGLWVPPEERSTRLASLGRQPAEYDLLRFVGIRLTPFTRRFASFERLEAFAVVDSQDRPVTPSRQLEPGTSVGLVGTSFSVVGEASVLLGHFIDQPVVDAAQAGQNPFRVLRTFLADAEPVPPILVLEVPNHVLFEGQGAALAVDMPPAP